MADCGAYKSPDDPDLQPYATISYLDRFTMYCYPYAITAIRDNDTGETIQGSTTSTIATLDTVPTDAVVCEAYTRAGECDKCRACWDKGVSVVAYIGHGRSMEKNQRNIIATTGA